MTCWLIIFPFCIEMFVISWEKLKRCYSICNSYESDLTLTRNWKSYPSLKNRFFQRKHSTSQTNSCRIFVCDSIVWECTQYDVMKNHFNELYGFVFIWLTLFFKKAFIYFFPLHFFPCIFTSAFFLAILLYYTNYGAVIFYIQLSVDWSWTLIKIHNWFLFKTEISPFHSRQVPATDIDAKQAALKLKCIKKVVLI